MANILIGTAGWSLRKEFLDSFPPPGTHLQRYARRLNAVEINSSFYRPHRRTTYQRWAESTPAGFRFAVKMPKQITHVKRLVDVQTLVDAFLAEISGLGEKLGVVLVQLPPSLAYHPSAAETFFAELSAKLAVPIVCEPRHRSWFDPAVEAFLVDAGISRVAADPAPVPAAALPGGSSQVVYYRWHGSPRMYYSGYDDAALRKLAGWLVHAATQAWCILDNTAEGEALRNALQLNELIRLADTTQPPLAGNASLAQVDL